MAAVATVVIGWGVAQWPYMLPQSLKVSDAAAPDPTLASILVVFAAAAVLILPSLALLYYLDQRSALSSDGADVPGAGAGADAVR
jgi:cytochrome d ubiquinol oxidase subunit II